MIRRIAAVLVVVGAILALWVFWWEPRRLVVRETSTSLECWIGPPIRIAIVSDLHIGSPYTHIEKLDQIVKLVNAGRPDVVVLLGDFVIQGVMGGTFVPPETIADHLSRLRAPLGTYAVLGNHDWWLSAPRVERALRSAGIHVIEDTAMRLRSATTSFWLVGVSDYVEGPHDVKRALSRVVDDGPAIAITTQP